MSRTEKKNVVREYVEAFGVALIAALILRALVIQAFRIPTGSMKDTLLVGDFLLVNKFIYGAKTPERIPLLDIKLPSFRFPALKKPNRGEVVVFKYPEDTKLDYIKRCVGVPGDTIHVRNGELFVNNRPEGIKENLGRKWDPGDGNDGGGNYISYVRVTLDKKAQYVTRYYDDIYYRPSFGPKVVPGKGQTIALNLQNVTEYKNIISDYEGHELVIEPGGIKIDGKPTDHYTFKMDYYFMMGDNRDNSQDSRYWGFMPAKYLVGEAMIIYWSWDKRLPLYNLFSKIRWSRIGDVIR